MNEYDSYIEDYLFYSFINMKADLIPRDVELERIIILTGKIEYLLEKSVTASSNEIFINSCGPLYDGQLRYEIVLSKDNRFACINYEKRADGNNNDFTPISIHGLTIDTAFSISANDTNVAIPFIDLYSRIHGTSLKDTIETLYQKLKPKMSALIIDELYSEFVGQLNFCRGGNFFHDIDYNLSRVFRSIYVKYLDSKKIIIPLFYGGSTHGLRRRRCFFPLANGLYPLFNASALKRFPHACVLLTDSIEIAGINQHLLSQEGIDDIVWVSLYSEDGNMSNIDWAPLKNRRIYCLLKEHSGLGTKAVFSTARMVLAELTKIGVKELKFASFLSSMVERDGQSVNSSKVPMIFTADQLEKIKQSSAYESPLCFFDFKNNLMNLAQHRDRLLSPIIYDRTATLIYGGDNASNTWFGLNLAFAMSQGKKAFEGWCSNKVKTKVIYLRGEDGEFSLGEKLPIILGVHAGIKSFQKNGFEKPVIPPFTDVNLPQSYPTKKLIPGITPNSFFWNVIDKNNIAQSPLESLDNFILSQVDSISALLPSGHGGLLVLDNFFPDNMSPSLSYQSILVRKLKRMGWATVIITSSKAGYLTRVPIDSVIRIKRSKSMSTSVLAMAVCVECGYSFPRQEEAEFCCELDANPTHPTWRRIKEISAKLPCALSMPRDKLYDLVHRLVDEGYRPTYIAAHLKISLSMVKKIKTKRNLSNKRAPRN